MDTQFERSAQTTVEWYTPPEIIRALGEFDLDPCTSHVAYDLNHSATHYYTKEDNGLSKEWFGRIWLNPPYDQPTITHFIRRLAQHGNGIALLFNRCDNKLFHDVIFPTADCLFFFQNRISFFKPSGVRGDRPGCGSILVAWGEANVISIKNSGLKGTLVKPLIQREATVQLKLF